MTAQQPGDVVTGPLTADRAAVLVLHQTCNDADGIDIPLFLEGNVESDEFETSFGVFKSGALVGFALLPADRVPEAILFVHPDMRRQGIGRALIEAVRAEARARELPDFLLVNDAASASGTAFAIAAGGRYRESEYRLLLEPARIDRSPKRYRDLVMRPATEEDVESLIEIQTAAFGRDESLVHAAVLQALANPKRQYHLGILGGESIGMLRTSIWDEEADVTAFGVLPSHQGRGYGRQILRDAIDLLLAAGQEQITIEVATENANALGLYQSCGFDVIAKFDYYDLVG